MKSFLLFCFTLSIGTVAAQSTMGPVSWKFSVKTISKDTLEFHAVASIGFSYHIYSQFSEEGLGLPTSFHFDDTVAFELLGPVKEYGEMLEKELDGVKSLFYESEVEFVQLFKVKSDSFAVFSGSIDYQACTDASCLLPANRGFFYEINSEPSNDNP